MYSTLLLLSEYPGEKLIICECDCSITTPGDIAEYMEDDGTYHLGYVVHLWKYCNSNDRHALKMLTNGGIKKAKRIYEQRWEAFEK